MKRYQMFCQPCTDCGSLTSKAFARAHDGLCKSCSSGEPKDISKHPLLCPDCRTNLLTPYQRARGYHCDTCTRNVETTGGIYGF